MFPEEQARDRAQLPLQIHSTALVHPDAQLGSRVSVGPNSIIGPGVVIGDETEIGANVVIEGRVRLGRRNRIYTGAVIGSEPQDLKYEGADSAVEIGDDNMIREYATINVATCEGEVTKVGSACLIMAYAHVAHNCVVGDHVILANSVNLAGHVWVGDHAIIGGLTPVHQFVVVGDHAFVGGGSRIPQDVPPFCKVAGNPPRPAGINETGLVRRGFTPASVARIKAAYRELYRRNLRAEEALERICAQGVDEIAEIFREFFRRSQRGIVR